MASISNAGDMITGVYESGWESLPKNRNGVILQFGMPQKKFGLAADSANFIASHIGIEVSKTITIDSEQKGSLLCEVKTDDETAGTGWYGIEDVIEDIPESCELMILNRADNPSNQYGVTNHLSLLQRSAMIAVTGIEDPSQHGLALKIAQICRGFIRIDSVVFNEEEEQCRNN